MKNLMLLLIALLTFQHVSAQPICNSSGNLIIFSNYDGGVLNINIDQNIPNLKIGILSYEAVSVNLTGAFVNNVTGIAYAGYNGSNTNCGNIIPTTVFSGVPSTATTNISNYPPVTLPNSNGNSNMVCAYSCDVNSNQGGCNTVDQSEAYFLNYFQGSIIHSHRVQYGCWTGTQNVSLGGNCCATVVPLTLIPNAVNASCQGVCNGSVTPSAAGGQAPYVFTLNNTSNFTGLCAGNYILQVTDAANNTVAMPIVINNTNTTPAPSADPSQTFCNNATVADLTANGNAIQWYSAAVGGSPLNSNTSLSTGLSYFASQTINGCESASRAAVQVTLNTTPLPIAQQVQSFCSQASISDIMITGQNIRFYADSIATQLLQNTSDLVHGQTIYATQTVNNCESRILAINIEITDIDKSVSVSGLTLSANQLGAFYRWLNCNAGMTMIPGAFNHSFTASVNGQFAVEITLNICKDTSDCITINQVNVTENSDLTTPHLYPNPASDLVYVKNNSPIRVEIFDLTGKQVMGSNYVSVFDIGKLIKGVYFVKCFNLENKLISTQKLVKLN